MTLNIINKDTKLIEVLESLMDGRGSYKEEDHYKFMENIINKKIKKIRNSEQKFS